MNKKSREMLNSVKFNIFHPFSANHILKQSINKFVQKYTTCEKALSLNIINQAVNKKKCRLRQVLKEYQSNRQEQIMEGYCPADKYHQQFEELIHYYKYYMQTSILYQVKFFKLMQQNRQRKKVAEYNKLKVVLNLSKTQQSMIEKDAKKDDLNSSPMQSFNVLSNLQSTKYLQEQQSLLFSRLGCRLAKKLGPNSYKSIQQIDKNYYFSKKVNYLEPCQNMKLKSIKAIKYKKQYTNVRDDAKITRLQTKNINSSAQSLNASQVYKSILKHRNYTSKRYASMENMNNHDKQQGKRVKIVGNWMSTDERNIKFNKIETKNRQSQEKVIANRQENSVKSKILFAKERIQKEKQQLRVKRSPSPNQIQLTKQNKKTKMLVYPRQKNNRKVFKVINL